METIKRFFAPPVFEGDQEKTRHAHTMNGILWFFLVSWVLGGFSIPFTAPQNRLQAALTILTLFLTGAGGLFALHRGYVRGLARFFSFSLWASTIVVIVLMGGIESPETGSFILAIVFAGLFLGTSWVYIYTGLSIAATLGIYLIEINKLLPPVAGVYLFR